MGIENRFQLRTDSESYASELISSFYRWQHVFLTVTDCKTITSNCISAAGNVQQEGVMSERKKRSKAWLHFTREDEKQAQQFFSLTKKMLNAVCILDDKWFQIKCWRFLFLHRVQTQRS